MTRQWGPQARAGGGTRFALWAPDKARVMLEIDGRGGSDMRADGNGWFVADMDVGAGTRYRFRIDGTAVPDPASRRQADGPHGWSVVTDPEAHRWSQAEWRGRPWRETVIQEVHAGLMGGFTGVTRRLAGLAALGITAIELMPIADFTGNRGWGYDGVLPYAVHEAYGTPDELKAMIDAAHALGIMVFLDVVYNHFGPDGNYLGMYASPFFHEDAQTPWGGAVAVDKAEVARFFIDNAAMWLEEYRFDGLRFDAVHAIDNDAFLDTMAAELRERTRGRHVHLILENERNDADRLAPGKYDAQWNDDFHNVLHVLLTGETDAYYADFADAPATKLARCLKEGFIYQGDPSPNHDGKSRGKPSAGLQTTRFVSFLQNHDQIGNRAMGERLTVLTSPERLRAATALLLLAPQVPLIFMGDAKGSRTPFFFFTDFHDELADAVREGRRREFAKFAAFADPQARERIPDPNARSTFDASKPEPGPDADAWRALYAELLAIRHEAIAPRLDDAHGEAADVLGPAAVHARWRLGDGAMLAIAINLGEDAVTFPDMPGERLFHLGEPGAPASFVATMVRA